MFPIIHQERNWPWKIIVQTKTEQPPNCSKFWLLIRMPLMPRSFGWNEFLSMIPTRNNSGHKNSSNLGAGSWLGAATLQSWCGRDADGVSCPEQTGSFTMLYNPFHLDRQVCVTADGDRLHVSVLLGWNCQLVGAMERRITTYQLSFLECYDLVLLIL